jgi:GNAT superfamily N-acetyltransferase
MVETTLEWRGSFTNAEVNALHGQAFDGSVRSEAEWDWSSLVLRHSLGWVVARDGQRLVGFVNVLWDGHAHAWIQDTMVDRLSRHNGVGASLIAAARDGATRAGCEWLHVDFPHDLAPFYLGACGFVPTSAGLLALQTRNGHPSRG